MKSSDNTLHLSPEPDSHLNLTHPGPDHPWPQAAPLSSLSSPHSLEFPFRSAVWSTSGYRSVGTDRGELQLPLWRRTAGRSGPAHRSSGAWASRARCRASTAWVGLWRSLFIRGFAYGPGKGQNVSVRVLHVAGRIAPAAGLDGAQLAGAGGQSQQGLEGQGDKLEALHGSPF